MTHTHTWSMLVTVTLTLITALAAPVRQVTAGPDTPGDSFTFYVTSDVQGYDGPGIYDTCEHFRGVLESIDELGAGAFMVSPGDMAPLPEAFWTITSTLGSDYLWYPVIGNHEFPNDEEETTPGSNLAWLRAYNLDTNGADTPPDLVRTGPRGCPETTYSFDYGQAHFVALNVYCDTDGDTAAEGDITDHLYEWLVDDLASNTKPLIFVFGHEPAYPQPDAEINRIRHLWNSLNEKPEHRDRFWQLLKTEGVAAYISGHTHGYSAVRIDGVWHIDVAHARGTSDAAARSTFLRVLVDEADIRYEAYRQTPNDACDYELVDAWSNNTTTRDISTPTPVPSPTPAPHSMFVGVGRNGVASGLGLGLLALGLIGGSVCGIIAIRSRKH